MTFKGTIHCTGCLLGNLIIHPFPFVSLFFPILRPSLPSPPASIAGGSVLPALQEEDQGVERLGSSLTGDQEGRLFKIRCL